MSNDPKDPLPLPWRPAPPPEPLTDWSPAALDRAPMPRLAGPSDEDVFTLTPPPRERWVRHAVLLALTLVSTTYFGGFHYVGFLFDFGADAPVVSTGQFWTGGLWYSLTILAILGCHEMGHYLACRYYRVSATLPYFLPAPVLTGTLGAFIRIRERIPTKQALFDIGIAGPLAGFVVAVPALFVGVAMSRVVALPDEFVGFELGEPLLFRAAAWLLFGPIADGYSLNLHPMAFAAWFGLLATALNLFPVGQLDGGHIAYAVLGRRSSLITIGMIVIAIGLTVFSLSWLVWTVLMIGMLVAFGPHHPATLDDVTPVDRTRVTLALVAAVIFIICFTPAPIEPLEIIRPR
ncbi:MAG: site-2 protease family protein [Vicinamibacterales bacterium]|nr:site-2 protease family protein [Vicinamibacterales bacterium]